jgi:hypothetical protein
MEKVGIPKVNVEGLHERMARLKKGAGTDDDTQPRQALRVLRNPNLDSNKDGSGSMAASGSNKNGNDVMASSGAEIFDDTNVSTLESVSNREGSFKESVYGMYFSPHTTDVTYVENASFTPITSAATNVDANLPTGDGVGVSTMAGRFTLKTSEPIVNDSTKATTKNMGSPTDSNPIVHSVEVNSVPKSYVGVTTGTTNANTKVKPNFRTVKVDNVFKGVDISIPRKVVQNISNKFEFTLYGYFIGKRIAFPVVEYFVRNNWAKHGLKRVMMNDNGFFFFKFDSQAGLDAILEEGPWMIKNSPIILKKWTMDTSLKKEELTRIPIWVKLHDVPLQVFSEDGISIIATHLGKPIMLDSYTSVMCIDSWGRSSFARCLIEIDSHVALKESITVGVPLLDSLEFTSETIRVEYEWKPPRCDVCLIFGHSDESCPKKVVTTPVAEQSNDDDGFQQVGNKKNRKKGKAKVNDAGNVFNGFLVGKNMYYRPKATTIPSKPHGEASTSSGPTHEKVGVSSASSNLKPNEIPMPSHNINAKTTNHDPKVTSSKSNANISTSNPFESLALDEGVNDETNLEDEEVVNVFDESGNLFDQSGASTSVLNVPDV